MVYWSIDKMCIDGWMRGQMGTSPWYNVIWPIYQETSSHQWELNITISIQTLISNLSYIRYRENKHYTNHSLSRSIYQNFSNFRKLKLLMIKMIHWCNKKSRWFFFLDPTGFEPRPSNCNDNVVYMYIQNFKSLFFPKLFDGFFSFLIGTMSMIIQTICARFERIGKRCRLYCVNEKDYPIFETVPFPIMFGGFSLFSKGLMSVMILKICASFKRIGRKCGLNCINKKKIQKGPVPIKCMFNEFSSFSIGLIHHENTAR